MNLKSAVCTPAPTLSWQLCHGGVALPQQVFGQFTNTIFTQTCHKVTQDWKAVETQLSGQGTVTQT